MFTRRILSTFVSISLLFLSGCKIETPPVTITVNGGSGGTDSTTSQLSCAATVSASIQQIISGQNIPVTIQVVGGTGPYQLASLAQTFLSQVTVTETFQNTGTQSSQTTRTYSIADSSGNSATCQLTVTVYPTIPPPSTLACAFSVDDSTPRVGQLINYAVTVTGGIGPFTSSQYSAGADTTYASALTQGPSGSFSSSAIYGVSGYKTASATIRDASGVSASCSQVVNVLSAPSVSVTASPSSTVPSGSTITLTATTSNFDVAPDVTFSTSSGGVTFTAVGNSISVATTDYLARTVVVDVVASNATQQASTSITLNFTATQTLTCNLYHASGYYQVGDNITFSVSSSTGQSLALTSLTAQDGVVVDALGGSSARIRFTSSGYKTVYATAQTNNSYGAIQLCNSGATLSDSIYINSAPVSLSCNAVTSPNPSTRGNFFLVRAQVPSGSGVGTVRLTSIQTSWDAVTSYSYYNDATSSYMAIYNAGTFPIVLTVRDEAGNTATCSTSHVVYW